MELNEAQEKARKMFAGIEPAENPYGLRDFEFQAKGKTIAGHFSSRTPPGIGMPELLVYGFNTLLGINTYGPEEKLRWGVCFYFAGSKFAFEYRKFGLRFLVDPNEGVERSTVDGIIGRSRGLVDLVDKFLTTGFIDSQIDTGNFSATNLYGALEQRYEILRTEAIAQYNKTPPPPIIEEHDDHSRTITSFPNQPRVYGGAFASGCIGAYFSMLEHAFCLLYSLTSESSGSQLGMREFLGANWSTKIKTVLDLTQPGLNDVYEKLITIRNEWRNPLAHGGFLSGGASLFFHLPGVAALPVKLRRTPQGVFSSFSMGYSTFEECLDVFDEFDRILEDQIFPSEIKLIKSGLNIRFDEDARRMYQEAIKNESIDDLINRLSYLEDMHDNMDY